MRGSYFWVLLGKKEESRYFAVRHFSRWTFSA
jgi:hypothetical protein